jgi:hypothetical protein
LNTTLTPHSIIPGDACFAYFNKNWGIPLPHGVALSQRGNAAANDNQAERPAREQQTNSNDVTSLLGQGRLESLGELENYTDFSRS